MFTAFQTVLGVAVLVGAGSLLLLGRRLVRTWLRYRGTRVVVCPESREPVAVGVDVRHAALSASQGRLELRLDACSRWPERRGCGQECLGQIASAPEACLLRHMLEDWYREKDCAFCRRPFGALRWHDHRPALLAPDGGLLCWSDFRPEQVLDVLAACEPVCWDCHVAESFRRGHPELVTDRPPRSGGPTATA